MSDRILSLTQTAYMLGKEISTVRSWIKDGCPTVTLVAPRQGDHPNTIYLDLSQVTNWVIQREVTDILEMMGLGGAAGLAVPLDEAKRRKAVADAISAEIDTEVALKKVVSVEDALDVIVAQFAAVREALQPVGAKVAGRAATMSSAPAIEKLVTTYILEALESLNADAAINP